MKCACGRVFRQQQNYLEHLADEIIAHASYVREHLRDVHDSAYSVRSSSIIGGGRGGEAPSPLEMGSRRAKHAWYRLLGRDFEGNRNGAGLAAAERALRELADKVQAARGIDPEPDEPYVKGDS